jgi:hypothetical protein
MSMHQRILRKDVTRWQPGRVFACDAFENIWGVRLAWRVDLDRAAVKADAFLWNIVPKSARDE